MGIRLAKVYRETLAVEIFPIIAANELAICRQVLFKLFVFVGNDGFSWA